jgi:hypothetical protein
MGNLTTNAVDRKLRLGPELVHWLETAVGLHFRQCFGLCG